VRALSSHTIKVHNADSIKDSEYFRKNFWDNVTGDLSVADAFVGRQRIVELPLTKNVLVVAHSRFTTIRPYHLDALWCGIPLVHNSTLLRDLHAEVARGYYPNNDISLGAKAAQSLIDRWISQNELFQVRKAILHRFGILNESLRKRWKEVCDSEIVHRKTLRIGFSDMWAGFNPSYNFFTLLLQSRYTVEVSESPDILIFGPFGETWKKYTGIPKIHYTGENTPPVTGEGVVLNLGFERRSDDYIRLPLWMLEIDWFGADEKIRNPLPVPLEPTVATERKKFCAFVVSNPCQPVRNRAFHALSMYKEVDSAGSTL
jgi:hypothetical protein